ncbi:8887_t:CDS:2 [Cetraspora pellucida]|uniref:8887_t:CDS:1 n=1 Tax=Cetraspora pellucida TaxID=1433469 RepID=A0ACA9LIK9_9GLOM|nr:8887_t:CDS:2 [Cetraspora pellucida]
MSDGRKGDHTPFITLQCTIGAALNENTKTWIVTFFKSVHNHELLIPSQIYCLSQHQHLNIKQKELKVVYAKEINEVEKEFKEVSQATIKSRDPKYIQNYLEKWKKDAKY